MKKKIDKKVMLELMDKTDIIDSNVINDYLCKDKVQVLVDMITSDITTETISYLQGINPNIKFKLSINSKDLFVLACLKTRSLKGKLNSRLSIIRNLCSLSKDKVTDKTIRIKLIESDKFIDCLLKFELIKDDYQTEIDNLINSTSKSMFTESELL